MQPEPESLLAAFTRRRPATPADPVSPSLSSLIEPEVQAARKSFAGLHHNQGHQIDQPRAVREGLALDCFRRLNRHLNGLAGFRAEFLPVLLHDLKASGLLTEKQHREVTNRIRGMVGAFLEAGELLGPIDRDGDGMVSLEEGLRAGLDPPTFRELDRDGDGRIPYWKEFLPKVANRLFEDRLLNRAEYCQVLDGLRGSRAR